MATAVRSTGTHLINVDTIGSKMIVTLNVKTCVVLVKAVNTLHVTTQIIKPSILKAKTAASINRKAVNLYVVTIRSTTTTSTLKSNAAFVVVDLSTSTNSTSLTI